MAGSMLRHLRGLGALLLVFTCGTAGTALAGSSGAGATPTTYGPARPWGGTSIRSLDPPHVPAGPGADLAGASRARVPPDQVLSNEFTFTRWAYVNATAPIYRKPRPTSLRLGHLTWYTADGFSSIYLLLRAHWDAHGQEWIKVRIPGRPNGRTGWVRRGALGAFHLTHQLIVVNRGSLRLSFFSHGRRVWSAPVGVGKPGTPTPSGRFWINERFKIADPKSGYWPFAFGTTDYSTLSDWPGGGVVGIHGPYYQPQLIPGRISHGCIRLETSSDAWLAAHAKLGTPVRVI